MIIADSKDKLTLLAGFQALSDPIRLQVVELLRNQELCVCDLCEKLDIKQPKLSFHLKILKEADLLKARQEGRWVYYCLNPYQFALLEKYLANCRATSEIIPAHRCDPSR